MLKNKVLFRPEVPKAGVMVWLVSEMIIISKGVILQILGVICRKWREGVIRTPGGLVYSLRWGVVLVVVGVGGEPETHNRISDETESVFSKNKVGVEVFTELQYFSY